MGQVWKIIIRPDPARPDVAHCWALADTKERALQLAGQPMALAYPCQQSWPGKPGELVAWRS